MTVDRKGGGWVFLVFEPLRAGQASLARWPAASCREQLAFVGVRAEQRLQRRALRYCIVLRSYRRARIRFRYCIAASRLTSRFQFASYSTRVTSTFCLSSSSLWGGVASDSLRPLLLRARPGYSVVKQISHHTYPTLDKSP